MPCSIRGCGMAGRSMSVETRPLTPHRPAWLRTPFIDFIVRQPTGAVALLVLLTMLFAGVFAEVIAPYNPIENNLSDMLARPSLAHLAGTDSFGRDIFSRLIFGARTALIIGLSSAFLG